MTTIFIIEHAATGDVFRNYNGMSQETVIGLMADSANNYDVVDEEAWQSGVAAAKAAFNEKRIAAGLPPV